MKKVAVLCLLAVMITFGANAQFRLGLRGGINTAYFKATEIETEDQLITTLGDATLGFHGGLMMQVSFFGLFIQPELLLSSIGSEVRVSDLGSNAVGQIRDQNYTKLDFPVLVGKRFGPARIGIGPVGTIMLGTSSELEELGIREQFNSATFGYQVGAGLDILGRIALDLKYEGNLTKLGNGINFAGQEREFDSRSRQFIVSVGIFF